MIRVELDIRTQSQAACDGDLNKIKRIVKLVGFVNAPPDFQDHPKVSLKNYEIFKYCFPWPLAY